MKHLAALLLLLAWPATLAHAESRVAYGPVPAALAALEVSATDAELARGALASIRARTEVAGARALLIMLGDGGLKAAAERLAAGDVTPEEKRTLLQIVCAARHPAADEILAHAVGEPRPLYRMLAAHGLGRGRSVGAVDTLATLARDDLPAVRIAALRSLFAHTADEARAARLAVPPDRAPALLARRLRWHDRAEDASPALLDMARTAYLEGRSPALRMAAAHYLALPALQAPIELLDLVVRELGGGPLAAWLVRLARSLPQQGYDLVAERNTAIRAMFTLLAHPKASPEQRTRWLHWAVGWVADPIPMDPYRRDPIPEFELRRRLPDFGAALVAPVTDYLTRGAFDDPRKGMVLLRELGPELALPSVRGFLTPRAQAPRYESRAEAQHRRYARNAAAGVLQEIGRVGDEALARALLFGDEPLALKVEIVHALEGDDGAWAVPVLVRLMEDKSYELRQDAILALQKRDEPEARAALVEDLFARLERPHDRLQALVRRGDEDALVVMKRALDDKRRVLRKAALAQFRRKRHPRLCANGKALIEAYRPDLQSRQEVQEYVYALLNVAPLDAVTFVDTNWDAFPKEDMRRTCLRILAETTGKAAREAAIDLALRRAPYDAPRPLALAAGAVFQGPDRMYDWTYRVEDIGPRLRAWLDDEDVHLQREALAAWAHPQAPDAVARLVALLGRALAGGALPERDTTHAGEQEFAGTVLAALVHQPWSVVEDTFVDVALDASGDIDLARVAAYRLIGKVSDKTRARLSTWLDLDPEPNAEAPGRRADRHLQLFLAAAVGTGADEAKATSLQAVLKRELWSFFSPAWLKRVIEEGPGVLSDDPDERTRAYDFYTRVGALARAVASTGHEPSVLATLELLFDPRLALYARECVRRQSATMRAAGADAAAIEPSELNVLGHNEPGSPNWGMPLAVYEILREAKVVEDAKLARALERVLAAARADGRLAQFPLLYLVRALESQLEPHTGRNAETADVLWRYGRFFGEGDTPLHYWLRQKQVSQLAEVRRFEEAAQAQRAVVRTLVRGNHTAQLPGFFVRQQSLLEALTASAAATRGAQDEAAQLFARARERGPDHPDVLNSVAWYRALARSGLEDAEAEALRATRLEARVENRPGVNAADTLAYVLLLRGRPAAGLRVLAPRMGERGAALNGLLHYHMAQLHASVGRLRSARDALIEALTWDRALLADVAGDEHLEPLLAKLPLERIAALAAQRRFEQQLP